MNNIYKSGDRKIRFILSGLVLFNILIHILVYNNLEYHRDEMLYLSFGYHPDFGYASLPPLIGWIAWALNNTFGYSLFLVKLIPALLSGIFLLLVCLITKELGGKNYAQVLAAIAVIITPISLRTFFLFQPVFIDLTLWTLIFYLVIRYTNTENENILIYIGIIAGLSLMNKYLIALLILGLLLGALLTPFRNIFTKKKFYIGLILGFLIFIPNIIWQLTHNIPATNHLDELRRSQLVHVSRMNFLFEQLINPVSATILTVPGLFYFIFSRSLKKYRFVGFTIVFVITILCILRGKGYYAQGTIPVLIAAGAVFYEKIIKRNVTVKIMLPAVIILLALPLLPFGLPVYKAPGLVQYFKYLKDNYHLDIGTKFEDETIHSLPQDYADMIGWEELTSITCKAYKQIENKNEALIYCENYGQASAINTIGKKYGLPEPVSFNESYIYWLPRKFNSSITSLIYINGNMDYGIKQLFDSITEVGKISDPNAREYGTTVYLCTNPKRSFVKFFLKRIEDRTFYQEEEIFEQLNQKKNLAEMKPSWASSVESESYLPSNAFDKKFKTRWSSEFKDPQWLIVDLEKNYEINEVILFWESAYAVSYKIQVSADKENWSTVYETDSCEGGVDTISFNSVKTRYVKMFGIQRATPYGYSLREFKVFAID